MTDSSEQPNTFICEQGVREQNLPPQNVSYYVEYFQLKAVKTQEETLTISLITWKI